MADLLSLIAIASQAGIALLFAVAAARKAQAFTEWVKALSAYKLLPEVALTPAAYAMPALECLAAILLAANIVAGPSWPLFAAGPLLATALLLAFGAAIAINLLRGRTHLDCGCDPRGLPKPIGWNKVAYNAVLIALLAIALGAQGPLAAPVVGVAAVTGAASYWLLTCVGTLFALGASLPKTKL